MPRGSRIQTEDGIKTIGEIVKTKYKGKVLSLNNNGQFVWNNVIGWSKRPNNGKNWVRIRTNKDTISKSRLICTEDHEICVIDDIFNPSPYFIQAKDSVGKYSVRHSVVKSQRSKENKLYNSDQLSAMYGMCLGDAFINNNRNIWCNT